MNNLVKVLQIEFNYKHAHILFKQRKNKTFNYRPRFSQESEQDSSTNKSETKDFISKWKNDRGNSKRKVGFGMSIRTLILVLVLLLICMYLLENKFN